MKLKQIQGRIQGHWGHDQEPKWKFRTEFWRGKSTQNPNQNSVTEFLLYVAGLIVNARLA